MKKLLLLFGFGLVGLLIFFSSYSPKGESVEAHATRIHDQVLTVDTHTDTPMRLQGGEFDLGVQHGVDDHDSKVDFPRMKAGGLDAQFFAVFVGQGQRDDASNEKAKGYALKVFDAIHTEVGRHPDLAEIVLTPDAAYRMEKQGKRAIYLGLENGYPIGNEIAMVQRFYDLGARYITLCHTLNNDICDSSTDKKGPEHGGLSPFGEEVVKEMNALGMLVDVSHASDDTFYDVLKVSAAPVIASHSCARAVCDNPRNLDDDQLVALAANGGVIQMCILSDYVKTPAPYPAKDSARNELRVKYNNYENLTDSQMDSARNEWYAINDRFPEELAYVSDVVDHIDHIVAVAGIDHVGIGTDFDGGGGVTDCFDVSQMGNITLELVKRGYSEEAIEKIWGGNFMRVFRQTIKVGQHLASQPTEEAKAIDV